MANFCDSVTLKPIDTIDLPVGQTTMVALYGGGPQSPSRLSVDIGKSSVALCTESGDVEKSPYRYFQLLGMDTGTTQLRARVVGQPDVATPPDTARGLDAEHVGRGDDRGVGQDYSASLDVRVTASKSAPISFGVSFQNLWDQHPDTWDPVVHEPCFTVDRTGKKVPTKLNGQCAIRMATALKGNDINLRGLTGKRCPHEALPGHAHHFIDPNDIGRWLTHTKGAPYSWAASKLEPKPLPGTAALTFMKDRKGIVLFLDFWGADGSLDHIDLWDGTRVALVGRSGGNSASFFTRARAVRFWELA